jgi:carbamoyl-phosphate synthase small subunit
MPVAVLALEDGSVFKGRACGARGECYGEVVFNTSLTGYQEIFTDPSYAGQIVILTNPQIGNYGTNPDDNEATRPYIEGLIVREFSSIASNWRSREHAEQFLDRYQIPVLEGIDTRELVRHLRTRGVMRGVVSSLDIPAESLVEKARAIPSMEGRDLAETVSTKHKYEWDSPPHDLAACEVAVSHREDVAVRPGAAPLHVVAYDFGIKQNILRRLVSVGCKVTVVPALTSAEEVLGLNPDGVFLSNGPGDPAPLQQEAANIRKLFGKKPIFGICLGHQVLGLALGGKTYKLKFGHRGGNHPVINKQTGKVEITAHNHGFAVDPHSLKDSEIELTHWNLNDDTLEGFQHRSMPIFSVQYHPEASPGPHDSYYLFDQFKKKMEDWKQGSH